MVSTVILVFLSVLAVRVEGKLRTFTLDPQLTVPQVTAPWWSLPPAE